MLGRKIVSWKKFNEMKSQAKIVLEPDEKTQNKHALYRKFSIAAAVVILIFSAYQVFTGKMEPQLYLLMWPGFFLYLGVLPSSSKYVLILDQGIFIYIHYKMLKWKKIISYTIEKDKKERPFKSFVFYIDRTGESKLFTGPSYRALIENQHVQSVENFFKGKIKKV